MPGWDSLNRHFEEKNQAELDLCRGVLERNGYEVIDAATARRDCLGDLVAYVLVIFLACGLVGSLVAGAAGMAAGFVVAGLVVVATGGTVWGR